MINLGVIVYLVYKHVTGGRRRPFIRERKKSVNIVREEGFLISRGKNMVTHDEVKMARKMRDTEPPPVPLRKPIIESTRRSSKERVGLLDN